MQTLTFLFSVATLHVEESNQAQAQRQMQKRQRQKRQKVMLQHSPNRSVLMRCAKELIVRCV